MCERSVHGSRHACCWVVGQLLEKCIFDFHHSEHINIGKKKHCTKLCFAKEWRLDVAKEAPLVKGYAGRGYCGFD